MCQVAQVRRYPPDTVLCREGEIEHVFTHFALTLTVMRGCAAMEAEWTPRDVADASMPSVFLKALRL